MSASLQCLTSSFLYSGTLGGNKRLRQRVYRDRKSTRLNSSHSQISYAVFCLKKKNEQVNAIVLDLELDLAATPLTRGSHTAADAPENAPAPDGAHCLQDTDSPIHNVPRHVRQ